MATAPLRTIGGYRLIAGLGKGGMALVFLALSRKQFGFTKLVVLKVLRDELDLEEDLVEMFIQEARLAARLNHPNVVQTYEVGVDDGRHFMTMEYLDGQALSAIITRVGAAELPLEFQLRVICDALEGLHYAHQVADFDGTPLGIVHRDISPQNVFVTYTGQGKILDFGIAKTTNSARTAYGMVKGKSGYMAPEQLSFGEVDRRTDLFAIGVMIWEAIAKRRLVGRTDDDLAVLRRRVAGEDPKIREIVPDAPPELADICDKAMATNQSERYATAVELREALERFLRGREPWDTRRVAAVLETSFADERQRVRRLVDEQTKSIASGPIDDLRRDSAVTRARTTLPGTSTRSASHATSEKERSASARAMSALDRHKVPVLVSAVLAMMGIYAGLSLRQKPSPPEGETAQTPPVPVDASSPPPKTSPGTMADRYKLRLTSEPSGVGVYDGDVVVGRTPFELALENAALAATPRRLFVRADGFEPQRVDLVPSAHDVSAHVVLSTAPQNPSPFGRPPTPLPSHVLPAPETPSTPSAMPRSAPSVPGFADAPEAGLRPLDNANPWAR